MSSVVQFNQHSKSINKYKGHSYSVIKDGATGRWRANLVVPLRPAKFNRDNFPTREAAERWIREIITSMA